MNRNIQALFGGFDRARKSRSLLAAAIACYAMLYEWRSIFELPTLIGFANVLKIVMPLFLIAGVTGQGDRLRHPAAKKYLYFFVLFMAWGLVSSFLSGELPETILQWGKHLPLVFSCYAFFLFLIKDDELSKKIMKIFVWISLFTVAQYLLLETAVFTKVAASFHLPTYRGGIYYGPFGILGQGSGNIYLKTLGVSLFRLYGFWLEPSTAAAFLLCSGFFAEILYRQTQKALWRAAGVLCIIGGGLVTFSNTAYLAVGTAGLLGEAYWFKNGHSRLRHILRGFFFVFVMIAAVFGRWVVAKYCPDNVDLRYLIGVRDAVSDPYGGRMQTLDYNFAELSGGKVPVSAIKRLQILYGVGFRIPGRDVYGRGVQVSASAPVLWLIFTGVIGIILLSLREFQLVKYMVYTVFSSIYVMRAAQAWLVVFMVHLSYGTFMTPFYFISVALVFAAADSRKTKNCRLS